MIKETAGRAVALDPDTFTSPRYLGRRHDGGRCGYQRGGPRAGQRQRRTRARAGASAWPSCRARRAMGFCFFNSIAIAAAHARARGLSRVAIVDYDVHHGNGTQWSFYDDPSVLFVSSHQYPVLSRHRRGRRHRHGRGRGLHGEPAARRGRDRRRLRARRIATVAMPVLEQFRPELILISAGFDAHMDDPLAGMRLTSPATSGGSRAPSPTWPTSAAQGRVVAVTEGGYDLAALADVAYARRSARSTARRRATARLTGRRRAARRRSRPSPASRRVLDAIIESSRLSALGAPSPTSRSEAGARSRQLRASNARLPSTGTR